MNKNLSTIVLATLLIASCIYIMTLRSLLSTLEKEKQAALEHATKLKEVIEQDSLNLVKAIKATEEAQMRVVASALAAKSLAKDSNRSNLSEMAQAFNENSKIIITENMH